jgi:hypothetical protein
VTLLGEGRPPLNDASVVYTADQTAVDLGADGSSTLTFSGQLPDGTTLTKKATLHGADYSGRSTSRPDRSPPATRRCRSAGTKA